MKNRISLFEFAGKLCLTTVVAALVPLAAGFVSNGKIQAINQVFLGLFVFLIGTLVQLNFELLSLRSQKEAQIDLWEILSETDASLNNVRKYFADIVRRRNHLYIQYFSRKVRQLERTIFEASANEELFVDQDSDTTGMMLNDFNGTEGHVIRFVHYLRDNDFLFDVHASQFFVEVANLVDLKKVRQVRRLFVCTHLDELENARSKKLIQFHAVTENFDYRVITEDDYERVKRDFHLPHATHDFGIYGIWYVYRSVLTRPDEVKGVFSSSEGVVDKFTKFFDKCWGSRFSSIVSTESSSLSLDDLFAKSPVSPNRPTSAIVGSTVPVSASPAPEAASTMTQLGT